MPNVLSRRKIDWHLMPLMCSECFRIRPGPRVLTFFPSTLHVRPCRTRSTMTALNFVLLPGCSSLTRPRWDNQPSLVFCVFHFVSSSPGGRNSNLILDRNGPKHYINQSQFNLLNTIFYIFFLAFEWPQNLALQYLPVGKWMRFVDEPVSAITSVQLNWFGSA